MQWTNIFRHNYQLTSLGTLNEEVEKKDQPKEAPMPNLAWSTRSQFVSIDSSLFGSSMIEGYMPSGYSHKVDIFRSKEMMKRRKQNGKFFIMCIMR